MGLILNKPENHPGSNNDQIYGRRPERNTFASRYSYVHWKICKEYLKCEILPWKKLRSLEETIRLEPLPTKFLEQGSGCRYKQYFRIGRSKYLRVVGYRELFMKREYAAYLQSIDDYSRLRVFNKRGPSGKFRELALGGGGFHHPVHSGENKKKVSGTKHSLSRPSADKSNKQQNANKTQKTDVDPKQKSSDEGGCCGLGHRAVISPPKKIERKQTPASPSHRLSEISKPQDPKEFLKEQAARRWKWPNRRKRMPKVPNPKFVVLLHRLYRLSEEPERGNEWLYLSDTDPNDEIVEHFTKKLHPWMTEGISFESQKLRRQLRLYLTCLTISGRSILHMKNDFARAHVQFSAHKHNTLPFAITTILLWAILGIIVCSYLDINATKATNLDDFFKIEKIELNKYWLPLLITVADLLLVSFWSLGVLLADGAMIAHYLNCWTAALHEMETSGALDIQKITLINLLIYIAYAVIYSIMFFSNKPKVAREAAGAVGMLLLRPAVPFPRISHPGKLFLYQTIGFGVKLYVMFCARMVMTLLQIFALMLKNVSEMWNFKFALAFKLLAVQNRGQLFELELNHSLGKLWNHHRLITVLLENYGTVFCTAIMCYVIPQSLLVAVSLVEICFYDDYKHREFYGNESSTFVYSDAEPPIEIKYFLEPYEVLLIALLVLLHAALDFIFTSETLIAATEAYMTGAEFVRRAGMMNYSSKSHERRMLLSLQWSFSPTRLYAMTANRYFTMSRYSLFKVLSTAVLVFTLLVRFHVPEAPLKATFPLPGSCNADLGQTLVKGICTVTFTPTTASHVTITTTTPSTISTTTIPVSNTTIK